MKPKRTAIIGAGNRVINTIFPAVALLSDKLVCESIYSKNPHIIKTPLHKSPVTTQQIKELNLHNLDLLIVSITPENIPEVLQTITEQDVHHIKLLIDTPVLRFRQIFAAKMFRRFKHVYTAEDYIGNTAINTFRELLASTESTENSHIYLFHNGYRHHAIAMLKHITKQNYLHSGKLLSTQSVLREVQIRCTHNITATVIEPRNYIAGRMLILNGQNRISDYFLTENDYWIQTNSLNGAYTGISVRKGNLLYQYSAPRLLHKCMVGCADKSILNQQKVEGLSKMIHEILFNETGAMAYSAEHGLYDYICSLALWKRGYFFDIGISEHSSVLTQLISKFL